MRLTGLTYAHVGFTQLIAYAKVSAHLILPTRSNQRNCQCAVQQVPRVGCEAYLVDVNNSFFTGLNLG